AGVQHVAPEPRVAVVRDGVVGDGAVQSLGRAGRVGAVRAHVPRNGVLGGGLVEQTLAVLVAPVVYVGLPLGDVGEESDHVQGRERVVDGAAHVGAVDFPAL